MKIILVRNKPVWFSICHFEEGDLLNGGTRTVTVTPDIIPRLHCVPEEKRRCEELERSLPKHQDIKIHITPFRSRQGSKKCSVRIQGEFLRDLAESWKNRVTIKLRVSGSSQYRPTEPQESCAVLKTKDMNVKAGCTVDLKSFWCMDSDVHFPNFLLDAWEPARKELFVIVTVSAILAHSEADSIQPEKVNIMEKMLREEIATDFTILSSSDSFHRCHKSVLCAHSKVFQTMFQINLQESQQNMMEMCDMTEDAVKAFLAYLYCWDIEDASKNCLVAVALLNAGHKYDIGSLEDCMKSLLLEKPIQWFTVDAALKLFLFARNLKHTQDLISKAVTIFKEKLTELQKSENYGQLFKDDPSAAMELCSWALAHTE